MSNQSKERNVMDGYTESQKKIITTAHTAVSFVVIVALVAMVAWFVYCFSGGYTRGDRLFPRAVF